MKKHMRIIVFFCLLFFALNACIITQVQAAVDLNIKAKSAVLMEASTGTILFEMNSHEKLPPASVTKVMTMLLIMEAIENNKISFEDIVICSEYAASMGGSQVYLSPGEQMSGHDLMKAIAVASGNDASVAMAEHVSGSEEAFVKAMNEKARELGMNDTNFINCNGLDHELHYTSAYDVALMSQELLKHTKIYDYLNIWIDSLRDGKFDLANTNKLIRFYKGATGIKTGSTSKALYCLSASAKRDDMQLISAIMAAPTSNDRFNSATKLLDYGFANYAVISGTQEGEIIGELDIVKGVLPKIILASESDFNFLVEKGRKGDMRKEIEIVDNVMAPVDKGQKAGEIKFFLGTDEVGRVNIVTTEAVEKLTIKKVFIKMFRNWLNVKKTA